MTHQASHWWDITDEETTDPSLSVSITLNSEEKSREEEEETEKMNHVISCIARRREAGDGQVRRQEQDRCS